MNITYWSNFSKRINSTKQPTTPGTDIDVKLKTPTSIINPVFTSSTMPVYANYILAFGRYYWVTNVSYITNDIKEFECTIDVLATYKVNITSSTFYVSYSANANKTWLADTRIPVLRNTLQSSTVIIPGEFMSTTGFYVLAATGQNGCKCYALTAAQITQLINNIQNWGNDLITQITSTPFNLNSVEESLESLSNIMTQTGVWGNAYADAPNNIRSCIWVPFEMSYFTTPGSIRIFLGQFDTGIDAPLVHTEPHSRNLSFNIPWQYSDWRRMYEDIMIHLPYCGVVSVSADSLTNVSSLTIRISATATDGCVAYEIRAYSGDLVIGRYSGQCSANYPIGISQQASAGQILNSVVAGAEKVASVAIEGTESLTSIPAGVAGVGIAAISAGYDIKNTQMTTHNSTIGGTGGGSGAGLSEAIEVYTVSHSLACSPADMAATMGRPFMEPTSLASLSGYCQCANATIDIPATDTEKNAVNSFLNGGFFIE